MGLLPRKGSAAQLHGSIRKLIARLRPETSVYPGHEYTLMLLGMALRADPSNKAARDAYRRARELRAKRLPTVPSRWRDELEYNPWLRASVGELAALCGCCE